LCALFEWFSRIDLGVKAIGVVVPVFCRVFAGRGAKALVVVERVVVAATKPIAEKRAARVNFIALVCLFVSDLLFDDNGTRKAGIN
jgi:hypothetical protein